MGLRSFGWLPPNINSAYGEQIDYLYQVIYWLVGIIFILTQGTLLFFIFKYRRREGVRAGYSHGSNVAEGIWTVIPGLILIWLALYQAGTWAKVREQFPPESEAFVMQVMPQQFNWHFRCPDKEGKFKSENAPTFTDVCYVPVDKDILLKMSSRDVIHSFFLPFARVKQDVMPGMLTRAWFKLDHLCCWDLKERRPLLLTLPEFEAQTVAFEGFQLSTKVVNAIGQKEFDYAPYAGVKTVRAVRQRQFVDVPAGDVRYVLHYIEVACAELCGLGHFRMRAQMFVVPPYLLEEKLKPVNNPAAQKFEEDWDTHHPEFNQ